MQTSPIIPLLTGLVILVTLRGQRVQMANAFRDVHRQARARARLIQLSYERNSDGTLLSSKAADSAAVYLKVVISNDSPDAISEVVISATWTGQDRGDSLTAAIGLIPVLKSGESRGLLTVPFVFSVTGRPSSMYLSWTDSAGIRWRSYRPAADLDPRASPGFEIPQQLTALSGVLGRGPDPIRWWNHLRNVVVPYDYWLPLIEPQDGLDPTVTRMQRFLIKRMCGGGLKEKLVRVLLKSWIARLGGKVKT